MHVFFCGNTESEKQIHLLGRIGRNPCANITKIRKLWESGREHKRLITAWVNGTDCCEKRLTFETRKM